MTLQDYLAINAITEVEFEGLTGVSQSRINAIKQGEGTSSLTAFKIMAAAPEITLFDLIGENGRKEIMEAASGRP